MAERPMTELPAELLSDVDNNRLCFMISRDAGSGEPYLSTLSWVATLDSRLLHLALDTRSRSLGNVRAHSPIQLVLMGGGGCFVVSGEAAVTEERIVGASLPVARIALKVTTVRNALHFGARLTVAPETEPTYDAEKATALDEQVFAALRRSAGPA